MEADLGLQVPLGGYYGYGRVAYAHGLGIDDPASVVRVDYSDAIPGPVSIQPLSNWANRYDGGAGLQCITYGEGSSTQIAEVVWAPGEREDEITPPSEPGELWHCVKVDWPAQGTWLNLNEKPTQFHPRASWMGSLIAHGQDASGQYYRRNRYYDASTGRFTQEDPIGLAGGINLYGFADGDPVSYDDPLGLCPPCAPAVSTSPTWGPALVAGGKVIIVGAAGWVVGRLIPQSSVKSGAQIPLTMQRDGTAWASDFVVTPRGTAVPVSQQRMKDGFDAAGFPSVPTQSPGTEHTLPNAQRVRAMDPSGSAPRRASFENANGQPVTPDGTVPQPPPRRHQAAEQAVCP